MITLKIPIILILKVLCRLWQALGAFMTVGMLFMILMFPGFSTEEIQFWFEFKVIMIIGAIAVFSEWGHDRIFGGGK